MDRHQTFQTVSFRSAATIVVYPGDLIVADDSGICVVPADRIASLIDEAESIGGAEDKMRELIVSKAPISELRPLFRKRYD